MRIYLPKQKGKCISAGQNITLSCTKLSKRKRKDVSARKDINLLCSLEKILSHD